MRNVDKFIKIFYTITYSVATIVMFFIWLFLISTFSSNHDVSILILLVFFLLLLIGMFINISQIVKLYNEEAGRKMTYIYKVMYYIGFTILWFIILIYIDYTIIKSFGSKGIGLFLFTLLFYIPGIKLIKKTIDKIKLGRNL